MSKCSHHVEEERVTELKAHGAAAPPLTRERARTEVVAKRDILAEICISKERVVT